MIWNLATRQGGPPFPLPPGQLLTNECSFLGPERAFVKRDRLGPGALLDVRGPSLTPLAVPRGESVIARNGAWLARWDAPLGGTPASSQRGSLELFDAGTGHPVPAFRGHRTWTEEELWEATLLSRRLGMPLSPQWPRVPKFVDPLKHLSALDAPLPEDVIQGASRAQLRLLRNAIVARRGATFESPVLQSLFTETSWYRPAPNYTAERLTPIDQENILRIKRREQALGGSLGDNALKSAIARARAPRSN